MSRFMPADWLVARRNLRATHVTRLSRCSRALTYLEPEKPTVRACDMQRRGRQRRLKRAVFPGQTIPPVDAERDGQLCADG